MKPVKTGWRRARWQGTQSLAVTAFQIKLEDSGQNALATGRRLAIFLSHNNFSSNTDAFTDHSAAFINRPGIHPLHRLDRISQIVALSEFGFYNIAAHGAANLRFKTMAKSPGRRQRSLVTTKIIQVLPVSAVNQPQCHERPDHCPACFTAQGNTRERRQRLKDRAMIFKLKLFLQSEEGCLSAISAKR